VKAAGDRVFYKDRQQVYRVSELERLSWLEHGFGTRLSEGWPPQPVVRLRQVHSAICLCADEAAGFEGTGDALISNTPGRYLSVRTADCIPILMVDERLRAIAAVHAGWRGTAEGIAARTVDALAARYSSRPEDLAVAIGPGICGRCYTVGAQVAARFQSWFPERRDLDRATTVDLAEANRRQLEAAGIPGGRIYMGAPCTSCHSAEFYSHRRSGGKPGRMISAVGIRP
jgi:polyphenol oxidase